ncbi:hypothetical protein [Mesorhizobium sp.]|uniref:hypothetical protein n=1 Tax=Mesorhizobium sp. TaxID=1871066 RepID=UPI000FE7B60F|nr:hypothetical protein [Mesorhizobium sp.]RWM38733.1 MAG: hypothetical protein EOR75_17485 [Mesorhizobium sp.]
MYCFQKIATAFGILLLPSVSAIAGECNGEYQPHNKGEFLFKTGSSFEEGSPLHVYRTCVLNLDPENDLKVSWYIPGPHLTWVPPRQVFDFPRRSADANARPLKGCFEYGHLGDMTIAEFLGDETEEALTGSATEQACRQQVGLQASPGSDKEIDPPKDGWTQDYTIFFPSDLENVRETMIQLDATVSVKNDGEGSFHTIFQYSARPYEGRKAGDPEAVRFTAFFPGASRYLEQVYAAMVGAEPVTLGFKGERFFTIGRAERYRPAQMSVHFLGKREETLAVLQVTVLAPVGL